MGRYAHRTILVQTLVMRDEGKSGNMTNRPTSFSTAVAFAAVTAMILMAPTTLQAQTRTAGDAEDAAATPSATNVPPRSPRRIGQRIGERIGRQTSRSPAPIGHRRRKPTPPTARLPSQVLVDADAQLPK